MFFPIIFLFEIFSSAFAKSSTSYSKYTNCILTNVWADGVNRTRPMLFTYNPKFSFDRPKTHIYESEIEYLKQQLNFYDLDPDQIVYLGKKVREKRTFVTESAELVKHYFAANPPPPNTLIFSDNGRCFVERGFSIFPQLNFNAHSNYPACVHQYISPNDNHLHGECKTKWRENMSDFHDDVQSTLYLLHCIDTCPAVKIQKWWDNNLLLPKKRICSSDLNESMNIKKFFLKNTINCVNHCI